MGATGNFVKKFFEKVVIFGGLQLSIQKESETQTPSMDGALLKVSGALLSLTGV